MATKAKGAGGVTRAAGEHIPDDAEVEKYRVRDEALREVPEELYERADGLTDAALAAVGGRLLAAKCPGLPDITFETRDRNNAVRKVRIRADR